MLRGLLMQHLSSVVMQDGFSSASPESTQRRLEQIENSGMPSDQQTALTGVLKNLQTFQESQQASGMGSTGGGGFSLPFTLKDETTASSKKAESQASAAHIFVGMAVQGPTFLHHRLRHRASAGEARRAPAPGAHRAHFPLWLSRGRDWSRRGSSA